VKAILVTALLLVLAFGTSDQAMAARTYADYPVYNNGGKPDLTIDAKRFETQMSIIDREFSATGCEIQEGAVGAPGIRRILRFDTVIINGGDGDLVVGVRSDPNNPYADYFYFATCHGHYHIRDFSVYELLSPDVKVVVAGYKQGFCFEDSFKYDGEKSGGYTCENQGITSGWGDWYYKQLGGQWIDITGIPEGDYIVRATINLGGKKGPLFDEGSNRYPNSVETRIHIPNPRNKLN
jgi:hypothetical protein